MQPFFINIVHNGETASISFVEYNQILSIFPVIDCNVQGYPFFTRLLPENFKQTKGQSFSLYYLYKEGFLWKRSNIEPFGL